MSEQPRNGYFPMNHPLTGRPMNLDSRPPVPTFGQSITSRNGPRGQYLSDMGHPGPMPPYMSDNHPGSNAGFATFATEQGNFPMTDQTPVLEQDGNVIGRNVAQDDESNPLNRMWKGEQPWMPRNSSLNDGRFSTPGGSTVYRRPHIDDWPGYRDHNTTSNPDSQITGPQGVDSGYHTGGPRTMSYKDGGNNMDDSRSLLEGAGNLDLGSDWQTRNEQYPIYEPEPSQRSCQIEGCKQFHIEMNPSDYKKHMQRHDKPFKCSQPNCTRDQGFTTKNDLERHMKSLHKISPNNGSDRSFICKGDNCGKRSKIWPRLDNFKSHCRRMHKGENVDELIKKSELTQPRAQHSGRGSTDPRTGVKGAEAEATLLIGISQGPHGQERRPSRSQDSDGILDRISTETAGSSDDTNRIPHSINMSRTKSQQFHPLPRLKVSMGPPAQPRHSPDPTNTIRSPDSTQRLAELIQQNTPQTSKPRTPSTPDTQQEPNTIDGLSKTLVTDLKLAMASPTFSTQDLQSIITQSLLSSASTPLSRKRSAQEANLDTNSSNSSFSNPEQPPAQRPKVTCKHCEKTTLRACDMKKHEKRHSRPWGCTNESCHKTFGSKNDWKRHENSQHYQLETWRCGQPSSSSKIGICARVFFRRDPFQTHLRKDHEILDEPSVREECRVRRIGRNWQGGFWCGFCKEIVHLSKKGLDAWDERFNHIDNEHFRKGLSVDDWFPLDKDVPKKELRLEKRAAAAAAGGHRPPETGSEDEDEDEDDESEDDGSGGDPSPTALPTQQQQQQQQQQEAQQQQLQQLQQVQQAQQAPRLTSTSDHRKQDPRHGSSGKSKKRWYCCQCKYGPLNSKVEVACIHCAHRSCQTCR